MVDQVSGQSFLTIPDETIPVKNDLNQQNGRGQTKRPEVVDQILGQSLLDISEKNDPNQQYGRDRTTRWLTSFKLYVIALGLRAVSRDRNGFGYLKTGVGKPWAWHSRFTVKPCRRFSTVMVTSVETRGAVLLLGSGSKQKPVKPGKNPVTSRSKPNKNPIRSGKTQFQCRLRTTRCEPSTDSRMNVGIPGDAGKDASDCKDSHGEAISEPSVSCE